MTECSEPTGRLGGVLAAALAAGLLAATSPTRLYAQCPDGTPPPCRGAAPAAPSSRSIAVLYFDNRSADSTDAYLADGVTEEIIARLTNIQRLEVKSRTAVGRFRGTTAAPDSLGRALRVSHLLSGTVQRSGNRLRISVELVRAANGVTAWACRFDQNDTDLLDIQAAIADTVARAVAGQLVPRERRVLAARPTANPEAWDRFLRGTYRLARRTPEDIRLAIREFETAVRLDPTFAAAHSRIALSYAVALDWGWPAFELQQSIRAGLAASSRALELDSLLADAWTSRGYMLRFANARTYAGVREAFQRALALAPKDAEANLQYGWAQVNMGEVAAGIVTLQRAVELDPDRSVSRFTLAWVLLATRRTGEAMAHLDTAIAADPTTANLYGLRAWVRLTAGDTNEVRADIAWERTDYRLSGSALVALEMIRGDTAAARAAAERMVAELPAPPARLTWGAAWQAGGLAQLREVDRVMNILERIEPQGLAVWWAAGFPSFAPIRSDPRFAQFVAELAPAAIR